jgi:hypothetical protein
VPLCQCKPLEAYSLHDTRSVLGSAVAPAPGWRQRHIGRDALRRGAAFVPAGSAEATPPAPSNEVMVILEATSW